MTNDKKVAGFLAVRFQEGQPVEVLRTGIFTDMGGQEVVIDDAMLEALTANFAAGAAEQEVPVDILHERGEAAGWVKKLWREGNRLLAEVEWNEIGVRLVGEKIYRYLSATLAGQMLKSISLVNFPAVKGLRPVELAEGVWSWRKSDGKQVEVNMAEENREQVVDVEALREKLRGEILSELQERETKLTELREQVRGELQIELQEKFDKRQALIKFAEGVCGGDAGLSAKPEEVVALLAALPDADAVTRMQAMLQAKVVDFQEHGSGGAGQGELEKLSAPMAAALHGWLASEQPLAEFFEINAGELGEQALYDLSAYEKEE